MIQVRVNGHKLERLTVIEHEIHFGAQGVADGSELTKEEINRLRNFHFIVEEVSDEQKEEIPSESDADVTNKPKRSTRK